MNTETPRTDEWEIDLDNLPLAAALSFADEGSTTGGLLTHAALKTLAAGCRELTAARAEIERLDTAGIHSCHDNCQRPNCVLRRELKAVTEQRDRLADLVKQFVSILDITEESDSGRLFHPTNITSCRAGDLQKIGELVEALKRASRTTNPNEL
jgi:hypothetical protein